MKLHETIQRVYKKVIKPFIKVEVLSKNGIWNQIESVNITNEIETIKIITETKQLVCAPNHILILASGDEILAKDCLGKEIQTNMGPEKVIDVENTGTKQFLYDLSLVKQNLDEDDKDHLYLTNDILSHNCVILDEFAFLQKNIADKLFTSMYPVISSSKNGKFIIVSTPNGTDNLYYDIWCQANSKEIGKNLEGWKPFEMHWFDVPGHDDAWKEKQIAAIGARRFAQEFNNEFITSSSIRKLVPDEVLERFRIKLSEFKARGLQPKKQRIISQNEDELYEFDMWHEFDSKKTYLASGDIAEGVGGDSSVLYIWDVTDLADIKMCAKFSSNTVSVVQFAYIARRILALYCDPWFFAERNGVSSGMLDSLRITYGYQGIASENKKGEAGVYSHVQVKGKACLWARDMLTTPGFGFTIYDKDLIDEFGIFVKKDTKGMHLVYQAMPGPNSHDDHVMAFIWMCYALSNELVEKYFTVCQTFTTEMEQIYAKILLPNEDYNAAQVKAVSQDPLYKEFLDFKDELHKKLGAALDQEKKEDEGDWMFQQIQKTNNDSYFGDVDDGGSWEHVGMFQNPSYQSFNPSQRSQQLASPLNKNNVQPSFYMN